MKPSCFQSHIHKNIIFSPPKEIKLFVVLVDMVQLLEVAMIFVSEIKVATNCQVNLNFLQILHQIPSIDRYKIFDLQVLKVKIFKFGNGKSFI